jgi:cytoskeleton protein RodZ
MDVNTPTDSENTALVNIGELLCEARDNFGLASDEIAEKLNLAVEVISKIENNEFEQDIPPAFIRGYIKSYATKVGLDTAPLLKEFDRQTGIYPPSLKRVQTIASFNKKPKELNSSSFIFKTISILIVIAFLSFAGWELWSRLTSSSEISADDSVNEQLASSNILLDMDASSDSDVTSRDGAGLDVVTTDIQSQSIDSSSETTSDARKNDNNLNITNQSQQQEIPLSRHDKVATEEKVDSKITDSKALVMTPLILDFSADCWVKITDSRDEVIALGVKRAGKHMPVEGVPPFRVILGDPSVVTMKYKNSHYDLSSYRSGRRAVINLN